MTCERTVHAAALHLVRTAHPDAELSDVRALRKRGEALSVAFRRGGYDLERAVTPDDWQAALDAVGVGARPLAWLSWEGWQQVVPHPTNDVEVMILGGGPSLVGFEDEIRARRAEGMPLVTLNGAYTWAVERGIMPMVQLLVDSRPFNARFVRPVIDNCTYLVASQCHPSVFEGLPRTRAYRDAAGTAAEHNHDRTLIWHTAAESIQDLLKAQYGDLAWYPIPGGSTALLRAIPLLRMLGYRKFHLFGCDSCVMDGAHHAYAQPENDAEAMPLVVGGRTFWCQFWMASQAQEFVDLIRVLGDEIELAVYGDGLLAWILKTGSDVSLDPSMHEVIPGLWVGGWAAAQAAHDSGFAVLGVRHVRHECDDDWVPLLSGEHRKNLDAVAALVEEAMQAGQPILVHCYAGIERAPLAVAWYLHRKRGLSLNKAYALVQARHPETEDRRSWIDKRDLQPEMLVGERVEEEAPA